MTPCRREVWCLVFDNWCLMFGAGVVGVALASLVVLVMLVVLVYELILRFPYSFLKFLTEIVIMLMLILSLLWLRHDCCCCCRGSCWLNEKQAKKKDTSMASIRHQ